MPGLAETRTTAKQPEGAKARMKALETTPKIKRHPAVGGVSKCLQQYQEDIDAGMDEAAAAMKRRKCVIAAKKA